MDEDTTTVCEVCWKQCEETVEVEENTMCLECYERVEMEIHEKQIFNNANGQTNSR